jgi:hypothetical protein
MKKAQFKRYLAELDRIKRRRMITPSDPNQRVLAKATITELSVRMPRWNLMFPGAAGMGTIPSTAPWSLTIPPLELVWHCGEVKLRMKERSGGPWTVLPDRGYAAVVTFEAMTSITVTEQMDLEVLLV